MAERPRIFINGKEFEGEVEINRDPEPEAFDGDRPVGITPIERTGTLGPMSLTASGHELFSHIYHGEFNA